MSFTVHDEHAIPAPVNLEHFEAIIERLQQTRGFDFTDYKRTSLVRRVTKRMHALGMPTCETYLDYLQVHLDEFNVLFNTILINVTSFFRDPDVWRFVADEILPIVIEARKEDVLRVWSAGCAGGYEPYSIAMLLAERLGADALRERVKIYATDVDLEALAQARAAVYDASEMEDVPSSLVAKYFDRSGSQYRVQDELRRAVSIGRHDLLQDAPISRIDLLVCRNTLMYFHTTAQSRILSRFYVSVSRGGYVLLGRPEMMFSRPAMFTPVDLKRRVFRPVPKPNHGDRRLLLARAAEA